MSDSDVDYLQPGFDPTSLTNPRLRSILVTYNVHYASNAKKHDLVELFNANVAPQASKILARRARAKRSSMGIVDADVFASQSTDSFDEQPEEQASPKKKPAAKRGAARKPRVKHEDVIETVEVEEEPQPLRSLRHSHIPEVHAPISEEEPEEKPKRQQRRSSPRKRATRSVSHQPAPPVASDTDTGPDVDHLQRLPPPPPSARASRPRTPKVKLEAAGEEELPQQPKVVLPTPRRPAHEKLVQSSTEDDSVFTDDNPFQSGSSPLTAVSAAKSARRKTTGNETHKRSSAGTTTPAARRRTDGGIATGVAASPNPFAAVTPRTVKKSPSVKPPSPISDNFNMASVPTLEPTEEFTPEEQLELSQQEDALREREEISRRANKALVPSRRRGVAATLATPVLVLVLTLLGAYGVWYRQEKIAVGYCGLGRPAVPLLSGHLDWLPEQVRDLEIPPQLDALIEPQCEPCPPHAFCYSDYSIRCENGYIVKPHPLSLGGLIPLSPTCEPDGERARRVKAVADKAVEELRDRRAKYECGGLVNEEGQAAESPAVDAPVLKETIGEKRSKKMSKEEFDDLWTAALGDIEARDEVEVERPQEYPTPDSGTIPNTRLSSTSLARLPFTCAVRRSIRLGLARYRLPLSVLVLSVFGALYVRASYRARRAAMAQAPALVDVVLARLATQKELWLYDEDDMDTNNVNSNGGGGGVDGNEIDESLYHDPFLFVTQLRDDVLRTTHSLAARERVWKHVKAVVEQNSNVRAAQREGRNGEVGRAWEWIGPVGTAVASIQGEGGNGVGALGGIDMSAVRRRKSGRVSWMPDSRSSSAAPRSSSTDNLTAVGASGGAAGLETPAPDGSRENRSLLHRRWQESRPIY